MTYWQPMINNEVGCFSWWVDETLIHDLVVCYPIAKILDNTMNYFCGYMVSAMVSQVSDFFIAVRQTRSFQDFRLNGPEYKMKFSSCFSHYDHKISWLTNTVIHKKNTVPRL